jgi:enoyl-CoA hydratase/carnithine racemase
MRCGRGSAAKYTFALVCRRDARRHCGTAHRTSHDAQPPRTVAAADSPAKHVTFVEHGTYSGLYVAVLHSPPANVLSQGLLEELQAGLSMLAQATLVSADQADIAAGDGMQGEDGAATANSAQRKSKRRKRKSSTTTFADGAPSVVVSAAARELHLRNPPRGLVLTSAVPNIYSGGLDLDVLARDPPVSPEDFSAYWHVFQQTWLDLRRLPIPVIAAVNGNAPAAGCILAVACDARVMVRSTSAGKPAAIGVTAARAGFAAPPWVGADLGRLVGPAKADQLLQLGTLVPAEVAASIGLVDRLVDDLGSGLVAAGDDAAQALRVWSEATPADDGKALTSEAIGLALDYMDTPAYAYWLTKATMRGEVLAALPDTRHARAADAMRFFDCIMAPSTRTRLGEYRESLRRR